MPETKTFTPAVIKEMLEIRLGHPYSLKEVGDRYNAVLEAILDPEERKAFEEGFKAYARGEDIYDRQGSATGLVIAATDLALKQSSITGVPEGQKAKGVIFLGGYLTRLQVDEKDGSGRLQPNGELALQFKNAAGNGMCTKITVEVQKGPDGRLGVGTEVVEPSSLAKFGMHDAGASKQPVARKIDVGPCPP